MYNIILISTVRVNTICSVF